MENEELCSETITKMEVTDTSCQIIGKLQPLEIHHSDAKTTILKNMAVVDIGDGIILQEVQLLDNCDGNLEISSIDKYETEIIHEDGHTENIQLRLSQFQNAADVYNEEIISNIDETLIETHEIEEETTSQEEIIQDDLDEIYLEDNSDLIDDPDYELPVQNKQGNNKIPEYSDYCEICQRVFKTTASYKRHMTVCHTMKEDYDDPLEFELCLCCGEPVDSAHTSGDFKCDKCDKLFLLQNSLDRHKSFEHSEGIWKCVECQAVYEEKLLLIEHMQIHPLNKLFTCKQCNREFSRKYHLDRHVAQTGCDGTPRNEFQCQVCEKVFSRKDNLRDHLRAHAGHTKPKKALVCEYCNKEFRGSAPLAVHLRTHTGEKPFACDLCPKRFPSSGAIRKHRRMHTGEKPYKCHQCDSRFAAKETLNRHVRTHTGQKPHACQFCGKTFIQAAQLRAHIFHHTGENAYTCPHCNRAFNRRARLTMHVKFVHEGAKPLDCSQCDKKFFRKEDLARHINLHSGVKPFKCEVCCKTFAVKSSVKLHMLTHRKEQPCSCDECGRAFIRQDCLLRHMRAKHRDVLEDILAGAEKKKLQQQLLNAVSSPKKLEYKDIYKNKIWTELTLTNSVKELLNLLVDEDTLQAFGWPDAPVDKLLDSVIKRCGHKPASEEDFDYIGRMRENVKLLFTVVIDDEAVKSLLNNQTVDEVILHVLKLAQPDKNFPFMIDPPVEATTSKS